MRDDVSDLHLIANLKDIANLYDKLHDDIRNRTEQIEVSNRLEVISIDRNELHDTFIDAYIVALGSNFEATKHLAFARKHLESLASHATWSTLLVNPDYTATKENPKPDYTNQCGLLTLSTSLSAGMPFSFYKLQENSKRIEQECERILVAKLDDKEYLDKQAKLAEPTNSIVSLDIDILAVKVFGQWRIIKQRYPFKEHEWIGVREVASQQLDS